MSSVINLISNLFRKNKVNYEDLLFLENMTNDNILKYDLIEWLKFKLYFNIFKIDLVEFNLIELLKIQFNKKELCKRVASYGSIKCLKYLHENRYCWDEWTFGMFKICKR
jgi:hypothetical protein